ncbi:MAG: hypothetical protein ACRCXN_12910 [Bacteroidales bacterium]
MSTFLDISIQQTAFQEGTKVLKALQASFYEKGLVATGETVRSLRLEEHSKGFRVFGANWIEFAEYGRGAARGRGGGASDFLERLTRWAAAVGFPDAKVAFLKYWINRLGTRLHRGRDPRFRGKQSGVLTDVLTDELIENLKEAFAIRMLLDAKVYLRNKFV